jgi:tRNA threonylcarbamoyladenosine biosynthesis protein TsaB
LAYAAGLQIVPVSSLAAIAREVITGKPGANVIVAQDARMHEVYVGCYGANNAGELQLLGEECIRAVERLDRVPAPAVAAGAAWQAYPQLLAANEDQIEEVSGVRVPRAAYLLAAGIEGLNAGRAILPEALVPAYLRATVAAKRPVVS